MIFFIFFSLFFVASYAQEKTTNYLDSSLSVDKRIDDLMSRMTLF